MTNKKITNNDGEEFLLIDDDAPIAVDDVLLGLLTDLGGEDDVEVRVYRAGANRQMDFLFVTTPNDFSLETIRKEWGGGNFRIHVKKNSKLVANRKISIAVKPEPEVLPIQAAPDTEVMLEMFKDSMQRQVDSQKTMTELLMGLLVNKVNTPEPVQQFNPMDMQKSMMEMMVAMKALSETEKPSGDTGQIDMLLKGIELAKDMNAGEKEASSTDVLLQAIKSFGGPISQLAQSAPVPVQSQQNPAPLGSNNIPATTEESGEIMWWKMQLKMLVAQAKKNKDTYLYANLIVDQVPPEKIKEFLAAENSIENLILIVPEIETVRPWFELLLKDIMELSTEPETAVENEHLTDDEEPAHTSDDAIAGEIVIQSNDAPAGASGSESHAKGDEDVSTKVQN